MIYQGDQLFIPILVKEDDKVITPEDVDDIRISVDGVEKRYSKGEITFNADEGLWYYFLKSTDSINMKDNVYCQVEIKRGLIRRHGPRFMANIGASVESLKGEW